jgi:ABC-type glycerol-3-phosphate transport system substrate-binding protein
MSFIAFQRNQVTRHKISTRKSRIGVTTVLTVSALIATAAFSATPSVALAKASGPYTGKLVYWFWAESDVPGSTAWMQGAIKRYEALHKGITIQLVPQGSDTLQGAFETTAQSKSGPDIAMQWATLPVLTPVWRGQVASLKGLVPPSEMANWLNTSENVSNGEVWAMPLYLLGQPFVWNKALFKKAGLNPNKGPATWKEFLADCAKLKAAGITPITMGDKDGFFGSWFQGTVGTQNLNSVKDLQNVYAGKAKFTDPKYSSYLTLLAELKTKGYINSDVTSIDLTQGWQTFAQGKGAMTWTTDGNVASWIKAGMGSKLGVQTVPKVGTGKLAAFYTATQSISAYVTSWSKNKAAAGAFLTWIHQPANVNSWYTATKAFPADKRFSSSLIKDPIMKQLYKLDTLPNQLWAENYAPPQVDSQGLQPAAQGILAGTKTPAQAAADIQRAIDQWRIQQPADLANFKKWARL